MVKALFIMLLSIFLISACAQPSRVDRDFGRSVKQSQSNQVFDPEAAKNLDPVAGMDGEAARVSVQKYRQSLEAARETHPPIVQTGTQTSKGKE